MSPQQAALAYLVPRSHVPPPADHAVHFYDRDESLVGVVAHHLAEGLRGGEAALAIATATHHRQLSRALETEGVDVARADRDGTLVLLEAEAALERFMVSGLPDRARFEDLVVPAVERARAAAPAGKVRVYGEMVDVLWARGNSTAVVRLEELWSDVVRARPFSLLCAYFLDGFAAPEHTAVFREICARHGSVAPSDDFAGLPAEEKLRRVAELEQRARMLEGEIELRKAIEAERTRLLAAERLARAEIALLYRLTDAANRAETVEDVYAAALDGISSALGVERASILLFDSDGVMRFKAWRGLSDAYRAAVEGHSPWRPEDRGPAPVLVEDVRAAPALARFLPVLEREGIGALGFFPLSDGGRLLGKFMVYYPAAHAFTEDETRLARAIAEQVAAAVDRKLAALERERLLGIVGHDLRNPLGAITISAGTLLRQDVPERMTKSVRRILTSAERMERLIAQILDFAEARHGSGIPLQRRPADLAEVAQHVLDELEAAHPRRVLHLEAEGDTTGVLDPDRLGEVLSNLVGNALQHGGLGAVEVRVRGDGDGLAAEVHNGGPPIPATTLPALFDPFRRGQGSSRGRSHSVGLGLYISREIVRAHGGTIEVRSSEEHGTTFTVRLPRG